MSTDRDTTRIIRSWLRADEHESADRVLDAVLDVIDATPQRRTTRWSARRLQTMNSAIKYGSAAAAIVIAALLGFNYLVAPSFGGFGVGDATPTPIPTPFPVLSGQDPLSPGRYQVDPALPMDVTIEVPAGWSAGGSWIALGPNGNEAPDGAAIRFYTASNLYVHPLVPGDGLLVPAVGPTADDLVAAIVDHPDWSVTGTEPITMDGHAGHVVHVTLPEEVSEDAAFYLFGDTGGGQVWGWDASQVFDIYMLDVAGARLIIDSFHFPGTPESDLAAQQAVLASIRIETAP